LIDDARPPKFLPGEVVRIVAAKGTEKDDFGDPVDAENLIGEEAIVQGARPTDDQRAWLIDVFVGSDSLVWDFSEAYLASTGLVEIMDERGNTQRVSLDPAQHRPWRDDLLIGLETETTVTEEVEALAKEAAAALRKLVDVDEIEWRLDERKDEPFGITLWAYPTGDALEAFVKIVGTPAQGWEYDEDESIFISARWERQSGTPVIFLSPGVRAADVSYRRWTSPKRRSLGSAPRT
jgi:hypothetical protein